MISEQDPKKNRLSQRQLQIGSAIHKIVVETLMLDEILSSRFHNVIFSGVKMNCGLKQAIIMFVVDNAADVKKAKSELNKLAGHFRRVIASSLKLRYVPEISFEYDKTSIQIEALQYNLKNLSTN
jgi:ribosome-binding factor A